MQLLDWTKYPNFTPKEMACKHCGAEGIRAEMMDFMQTIRTHVGTPIFISSGFRCVKHPVEQEKPKPGEHTYGMAIDIICHGVKALQIISLAQYLGIKRIGVHQKGNPNGRFIHIGIADKFSLEFPAALWTY